MTWGVINILPPTHPLTHPPPSSVQLVDKKSGMINIRAEDDTTPEEVLAQYSHEQQARGAGGRWPPLSPSPSLPS